MMTIWKFPLETTDGQFVKMPKGAKILSVGLISDVIHIWALVDNEESKVEEKWIRIHGTGHHVYKHNLLTFIGTVIQPIQAVAGSLPALVWHVFEEQRP